MALLVQIARGGRPAWRTLFVCVALPPMLITFSLTAVVMCAYFRGSATGNPFRSPYQEYESRYGVEALPNFVWQPLLPEPAYRHAVMKTFYRNYQAAQLAAKTVTGFAANLVFQDQDGHAL